MEYPQLNKNPGGKIEIRDFTGGINTARNPLLLQDDQVPEVENMVPFRGILTTRRKFESSTAPATVAAVETTECQLKASFSVYEVGTGNTTNWFHSTFTPTIINQSITSECLDSYSFLEPLVPDSFVEGTVYDLTEYTCVTDFYNPTYTAVAGTKILTNARFLRTVQVESYLPTISIDLTDYVGYCQHTDLLFEVQIDGEFHIIRVFLDYINGDISQHIKGYIIEDERYAYVPTIITGKSLDGTLATTLEDFNLLTPAFKEEWFPRASIVTESINEWHTLYPSPSVLTPYIRLNLSQQNLDEDSDEYMFCELYGVFQFAEGEDTYYYATAKLQHIEAATTVTFKFYNGDGWIVPNQEAYVFDVVRFNANMKNGFADIRFDWRDVADDMGSPALHNASEFFKTFYIEKIIVTARKKNPMYDTLEDAKSFDLINTDITTLYGGTRSGIADGTRRFFAGYPEGNLIRWSGLNDITYLPENNFAYVGDDAAITALAKQYGALIVFKENSTYNMEYTYSVEDGATTVLFPITPISNEYGCDIPATLQLVNDRLVWANTNGRVYILYSQYQYSRKNIADIGGNVYDLLKDNPPTFAAVWDKMYFLFSSVQSGGSYVNRAIIWDFDQSTYYNYYSNEKSQDRLSWFYWDITEITEQLTAAQTFEDVLYLNGANYYALSDTLIDSCSLKTKEFDFGAPTQLKNIRRIDIMAEIMEAQTVQIDYFGDNGTILYSDYRAISEIGNVVIILRPHILRLRTFSVRITGTKLSIQGIIITADTAGRLR